MMVRLVTEEDLETCGQIYATAFTGPPYREVWKPDIATEMLSGLLSRDPGSCWCIEADGEVAGFAFCTQFGTFRATIQEFAIAPRFQKRGLGTALMEYALKKFRSRKVQIADLAVNSGAEACSFYRKFGFRQAENYIIMANWLK